MIGNGNGLHVSNVGVLTGSNDSLKRHCRGMMNRSVGEVNDSSVFDILPSLNIGLRILQGEIDLLIIVALVSKLCNVYVCTSFPIDWIVMNCVRAAPIDMIGASTCFLMQMHLPCFSLVLFDGHRVVFVALLVVGGPGRCDSP